MVDNIKVFKDTLEMSNTIYKNDTEYAKQNTEVIVDGASLLREKGDKAQEIRFLTKGSVACVEGVVLPQRVALLNFADPFDAGGLVFEGVCTMEEDLCRCSNLYPCISQDKVFGDYYGYNRELGGNIFSDRLIYSKDVLFFRDESYWNLSFPVKADVITCPAPVECNDIEVFRGRIKAIIGAAYNAGVDILILGSWGCGAFSNDPHLVATAFKEVLDEYKLFDIVYFPFKCGENNPSENYKVFKEVLEG